jgi:CBS domain-containing protein
MPGSALSRTTRDRKLGMRNHHKSDYAPNPAEFEGARAFLDLYNELDAYMRERLQADKQTSHFDLIVKMARKDPYFRERSSRLQAYRALRNSIVHNPESDRFQPIANPHPSVIEDYRKVIRYVKEPPRALARAVERSRLYTVTWETPLRDCFQTMLERSFSLAPIFEGERLAAVFLDFTLMLVYRETHGFTTGKFERMEDLRPHLRPVGDDENIQFLPRDATVHDAEQLFAVYFRGNKALRAIFLTESGRSDGPVLGLLTAWDLLGRPAEPLPVES